MRGREIVSPDTDSGKREGGVAAGGFGPKPVLDSAALLQLSQYPPRLASSEIATMLPSSTKRLSWPLTLLLVGALPACDGITAPQTEPLLEVEARVEPGHIHSFETDVTFYAAVTNPADFTAVEDFTMIRAELSPAGAEDWTKQIPLTFNGTEYAGTTKFTANGTFRWAHRRPASRTGRAGGAETFGDAARVRAPALRRRRLSRRVRDQHRGVSGRRRAGHVSLPHHGRRGQPASAGHRLAGGEDPLRAGRREHAA